MPAARTLSRTWLPEPRPQHPISLKPAEMTTKALTLLAIACIDHARARPWRARSARPNRWGREPRPAWVGMYAEDRLGLRVDRIDRAVELGVEQVAKYIVADGAGTGGGPDNGDRFADEKWRRAWDAERRNGPTRANLLLIYCGWAARQRIISMQRRARGHKGRTRGMTCRQVKTDTPDKNVCNTCRGLRRPPFIHTTPRHTHRFPSAESPASIPLRGSASPARSRGPARVRNGWLPR